MSNIITRIINGKNIVDGVSDEIRKEIQTFMIEYVYGNRIQSDIIFCYNKTHIDMEIGVDKNLIGITLDIIYFDEYKTLVKIFENKNSNDLMFNLKSPKKKIREACRYVIDKNNIST